MSEELLPIELELMSLFDSDISPEKRAALIEKLQAHPELLEKYSAYLHIQDIELAPTPSLPDPVKSAVLKAARRRSQKVKWRERFGIWFGWILQPAVAAPAMVCLAFLAGYQLLESPTSERPRSGMNELSKESGHQDSTVTLAASTASETEPGEPTDTELGNDEDPNPSSLDLAKKLNQVGRLGGLKGPENAPTAAGESTSEVNSIVSRNEVQRRVVDSVIKEQVRRAPNQLKPQLASDNTTDTAESVNPENSLNKVARERPESVISGRQATARLRGAQRRGYRARSATRTATRTAPRPQTVAQPASGVNMELDQAAAGRVVDADSSADEISAESVTIRSAESEGAAAPRPMRSAMPSRVASVRTITSQEQADFDRFVASLTPGGSLDGVASSRLLRMADIAIKLREYPKARQWLLHVIRREDAQKGQAMTMLDQLRRQLED